MVFNGDVGEGEADHLARVGLQHQPVVGVVGVVGGKVGAGHHPGVAAVRGLALGTDHSALRPGAVASLVSLEPQGQVAVGGDERLPGFAVPGK